MFWSIAWEYAYLNVIPITNTINNPYKDYQFAIHPKDEKEYKKIILNLENYKNLNYQKDLNEYYYMIFFIQKFFINDYNKMIKFVGGYDDNLHINFMNFGWKILIIKTTKRLNILKIYWPNNYYFIQKNLISMNIFYDYQIFQTKYMEDLKIFCWINKCN